MGLNERRLANDLQTNDLPAFSTSLKRTTGNELEVSIAWDTFTKYDEYPLTRLRNFLEEIKSAIESICVDDIGKKAIADDLNTIEIVNTDKYESVAMEFGDKKLHFTVQMAGDTYSSYSAGDIQSFMEKRL